MAVSATNKSQFTLSIFGGKPQERMQVLLEPQCARLVPHSVARPLSVDQAFLQQRTELHPNKQAQTKAKAKYFRKASDHFFYLSRFSTIESVVIISSRASLSLLGI